MRGKPMSDRKRYGYYPSEKTKSNLLISPEDKVTKSRKFLTALILSAIIISSSGCEFSENSPAISPEASSESSSESSSLPESLPEVIITPESSEPEEIVEAEPVIEPAISFLSQTAEKGSYFVLSAENIDLTDFSFEDPFGYNRRFFQKDGIWYCLIPVDPSTDAGYYPLEISCGDFEFKTTITVADRKFKRQYLIVDQVTLEATLEDAAVREAFAAFFEEKRWNFTEEKLWNGEFVHPLRDIWYKETTSYGTFRTFSSGRTEWHNASDMATGGGNPVYSTNSGNVLFAGWLGLTGNTIILDHGCGIMSWHYHLSSIEVSEGGFVEKDQLIGRVGTTGLSTGNHLHFGITVGGYFVDPAHFMGTEPEFDFVEEFAE